MAVKMNYLIKRRPTTSHEELVAHWFANHMPAVIANQAAAAQRGSQHASKYMATLFDADRDGSHRWDGVAQLWFDERVPAPAQPHGTVPADSFQERAETYVPWATNEHVIIDGSEHLPVVALTLNPPFPTTRSGFYKVTFLVGSQDGADHEAFFAHWLGVHAPNVHNVMSQVGGLRYVVSHSVDPGDETYAGMAELYFADAAGFKQYNQTIKPDGMEQWASDERTVVLRAQTEMIGIWP